MNNRGWLVVGLVAATWALTSCSKFDAKAHRTYAADFASSGPVDARSFPEHGRDDDITKPPAALQSFKRLDLHAFHSLSYRGDYYVEVVGGSDKYQVDIEGDADLVDEVSVSQRGDKVSIKAPSDDSERHNVKIKISMKQEALQNLKLSGHARMKVSDFISRDLTVRTKQKASLIMTGHDINLKRVVHDSTGGIKIDNIDSKGVAIFAHNRGPLLLRGNVGVQQVDYDGQGLVMVDGVSGDDMQLNIVGTGEVTLNGDYSVQQINYEGAGKLNLQGAHGKEVEVAVTGSGDLNVMGELDLTQLYYSGSGMVNLNWVTGSPINVVAKGSGQVRLAGAADLMYAEVSGGAVLDAKFLRAKKAFINTSNESKAEIRALQALHAVAENSSNIYYYGVPDQLSRFVNDEGSVLRMS